MTPPSRVRLFWWLSVAIVAYWVLLLARQAFFSPEQLHPILHRLPRAMLASIHRDDLIQGTVWTLLWSPVTLGLAWLAAFRKQNWARWAFLLLFLFRVLSPFLATYEFVLGNASRANFLWTLEWDAVIDELSRPITSLLTIAAIVAVFTGNANDWFRKTATAKTTVGQSN